MLLKNPQAGGVRRYFTTTAEWIDLSRFQSRGVFFVRYVFLGFL